MSIMDFIRFAAKKGASDIHLVASSPPMIRLFGSLQAIPDTTPLTHEDIQHGFEQITSESQRAEFELSMELDFAFDIPDIGRLRANASKQQGTICLVMRLIPHKPVNLAQLGLPEVYREIILKHRGLIIITGPTGSGKSTTLSSMINYLNETENRRIITIEDPVEFVYKNNRCIVTQRELGTDTKSFASALRHILRQDPDVILVGEMRDTETASAVLNIAETGHLVLTTGHAVNASQSTERIVDLFPPHERPLVQTRLASVLLGIFCQTLVPKADHSGRVAAVEIMIATQAVRNAIRDGKIYQLPNIIQTQSRMGMVLLDRSLANLFQEGIISQESAFSFCSDPEEIKKMIKQADGELEQPY